MDIRTEQEKMEEKKKILTDRAKKLIIWEASAIDDGLRMVVEDPSNNQLYNFVYKKDLNNWKCKKVMGSKKGEGCYITSELKQPLEDGIELGNYLIEGHVTVRLPAGVYGQIVEISR